MNRLSILINLFFLVFTLIYFQKVHANWFCRKASSEANGDTFLSCGVATSKTLQKARDLSLDSAKKEFNKICVESSNCRGYETIVSPMRTDCSSENGIFTCYRALEFRITTTRKKDIAVNVDQLREVILTKRDELIRINNQINKLEKAQTMSHEKDQLEKKLADAKAKLEKKEVELIPIEDKVSNISILNKTYNYITIRDCYNFNVKLLISAEILKFKNKSENILNLGLEHEYHFSQLIGLGLSAKWGSNLNIEDPPSNGPALQSTTTEGILRTSSYSMYLTIDLPGPYYLKPEYGIVKKKREDTVTSFGLIGSRSDTSNIEIKESNTFLGLSIGFDSKTFNNRDGTGGGWFAEVGAKKINDNNVSPNISVGLNIGF